MVMVHGDDKGIVAPPRVARHQVVLMVTGIGGKVDDAAIAALKENVAKFGDELTAAGFRVTVDARENCESGHPALLPPLLSSLILFCTNSCFHTLCANRNT